MTSSGPIGLPPLDDRLQIKHGGNAGWTIDIGMDMLYNCLEVTRGDTGVCVNNFRICVCEGRSYDTG